MLFVTIVLAPLLSVNADQPVPEKQDLVGLELVKKCLQHKHGQMLYCLQEGLSSISADDLKEVDGEELEDISQWQAPAEARAEENPYPRDENSVARGQQFYQTRCSQCHGVNGRGDGPGSVDFGRKITDLTTAPSRNRTDGELMWKITEGGWPMPAFGYQNEWGRTDLWHVINFLRTLSFEDNH